MRSNTHSATLVVGTTVVHIDGIPDDCQHDDAGEWLHFNNDGQYFKDSELPNYDVDPEGWIAFQQRNRIVGGCCSCSKCGRLFTPNFLDFP